nr:hypothetical protein [Desulfobacula sp.]
MIKKMIKFDKKIETGADPAQKIWGGRAKVSNGHRVELKSIYRQLTKCSGRAKILASAVITLKGGLPAKLVFVRDSAKKTGWH